VSGDAWVAVQDGVRVGEIVRRVGTSQRLLVTEVWGEQCGAVVPVRKDGKRDQRFYVGWSGWLGDVERLVAPADGAEAGGDADA